MDASEREFQERLRATFIAEAGDILLGLARDLVALEDGSVPADQAVHSAFRRAHSLKGAARAVGETGIESVCQALESALGVQREALASSRAALPEADWFDAAHEAVDAVSQALTGEGPAAFETRLGRCADRLGGLAAAPETAAADPSAPDASPAPDASRAPDACHDHAQGERRLETRVDQQRLAAILTAIEDMIPLSLSATDRMRRVYDLAASLAGLHRELAGLVPAVGKAAMGELAAAAETALRLSRQAADLGRRAAGDARALRRLIGRAGDNAKSALMRPVTSLFEIAPKLARDLARVSGKEVAVKIRGARAMADASILSALRDPLIHLIRNAVDHGIEPPDEREAAGKKRRGTIVVEALSPESGALEIRVRDDGRGVDRQRLVEAALSKGLVSAEQAGQFGDAEALSLVFVPGFSTSQRVTDISGRGVGLDAVRHEIESLGGEVKLDNTPGAGFGVAIRMSAAVEAFRGVLVGCAGRRFLLPSANVARIMRVAKDAPRKVGGRMVLALDGSASPCARLDRLLGLPVASSGEDLPYLTVAIATSFGRRLALIVDTVLGETEARAKSFGGVLRKARGFAGAALLGGGDMVLTLDVASLIRTEQGGAPGPAAARGAPRVLQRKSVLVAEDTLTSRMVLHNILESAGYAVATAVDGQDAWDKLAASDFDLVVSDVEMPRLDGFGLTEKIRADKRLARLPVVLVTSLASRADRERGAEAGANAYIVKGGFDQGSLLAAIAKLI